MCMLQVKNIRKRFGNTEVLKDVSFSLDEGQVLAIIGSSGGGKTTLLRCLNFLETPDEGQILVGGKPLLSGSEEELRRNRLHFGLVFQNFNLFPQYTVLENITLAPLLMKLDSPKAIRENAQALLEQVGLAHKADAYPYQLSGGQQQRVAIARAIAQAPPVILADEPTGNLDSHSTWEIMGILKNLHEEGRTVILITHDNEIAAQAKRVIKVKDGRVESDSGCFA